MAILACYAVARKICIFSNDLRKKVISSDVEKCEFFIKRPYSS